MYHLYPYPSSYLPVTSFSIILMGNACAVAASAAVAARHTCTAAYTYDAAHAVIAITAAL